MGIISVAEVKMSVNEEIRIKIKSELYEVEESMFSDEDVEFDESKPAQNAPEADILEINCLGKMIDEGDRIFINYEETEATGMEGSTTSISFLKSEPEIVTMTRDGLVSATLVFEESKRHHCIYKTPFMPFEVCVKTYSVANKILSDGTLSIDYIVEIRGAKAERTKFKMQIL